MGMMNYLFEYSLAKQIETEGQERRFLERRMRHDLRKGVEARVDALEEDVGQMALFVRTLFRMLAEKGTIDRAEFMAVARAIDAQDGAADGKYTGPLDAP